MLQRNFLLAITGLLLFTTQLMATPVAMNLNRHALHPTTMIMATATTLSGYQTTPLIFLPRLFTNAVNFAVTQSATSEGQAIFSITGPANTLLQVSLLPSTIGFLLDGNTISQTAYPRIVGTTFGTGVSCANSICQFTTNSSGNFSLAMGGTINGFGGLPGTQPGLYMSNASTMIQITNPATGASIQIPYRMMFSYIQAGTVQTVRSLVFPPATLTPNIPYTQSVPGSPSSVASAQLNYSYGNSATFTFVTRTVCLSNGMPPTAPGSCGSCPGNGVQVTLNPSYAVACSGTTTKTCKVFFGGSACYPANLPAGTYQGTGSVTMTYT